jgi:uncharacterized protein (DUF2141 family)
MKRDSILLLLNLIIIHFFSTCLIYSQTSGKEGINLKLSNIRNHKGLIQIGVFRSEEGYPNKPAFGISIAKDTLKNGQLRLFIPLDKPGPVSLCILDDENSNDKMDYVLGIMPKEGFGFSNNPKITLRKEPPFRETAIMFKGGQTGMNVRMIYIY